MGRRGTREAIERHSRDAAAMPASKSHSTTSSFHEVGQEQNRGVDASTSNYYAGVGMGTGTKKGEGQFAAKEVDLGEDHASRYSIDIEKEIADINRIGWDRREIEEERMRGKAEPRRVSDLSRSSKSISALFTPRGIPTKVVEQKNTKMQEIRRKVVREDDDDETVEVVFGIDNGDASSHTKQDDKKQKEREEEHEMMQFTLSPSVYSKLEHGSSSGSSIFVQQTARGKDYGKENGVGVDNFRFSIGKAI